MFREMHLSQAIPPNTIAITFRYQITSPVDDSPLQAWLADNANGEKPIQLAGTSGHVTVRLRTAQKLYYRLGHPELHLNLWIVEFQELRKHSC